MNSDGINSHQALKNLILNTLAFTFCFATWMLNGVLVTFLVDHQVFDWGATEIGWLMGIPVLTGSLFRLPAGMLTDRFGGKPVFTGLLFLCAIPTYLLAKADSFITFALCSFGFGLTGASFAIGIAFTSSWYPKERQGTVLGVFGVGNVGAAITTLVAPTLLNRLTDHGQQVELWRLVPIYYSLALVFFALVFLWLSDNRSPRRTHTTMMQMLQPLKQLQVWRFGLFYFLVFGCFVAFAQWLMPYFVNVYSLPLVTAGLFVSAFSLPSGIIRAFGGWISDCYGGHRVMACVLVLSVLICAMLIVPKMEVYSPGQGILAKGPGVVRAIGSADIQVDEQRYPYLTKPEQTYEVGTGIKILPTKSAWHEPVVTVGQRVTKNQLLAKGVTRIDFQANVWIFAVLVIVLGSFWGIGKAAVYKLIPDHYPDDVGVVGGMVGVLGGLGGFVCPILFGYLLEWTGLWSSCWLFMLLVSLACLLWLQLASTESDNSA